MIFDRLIKKYKEYVDNKWEEVKELAEEIDEVKREIAKFEKSCAYEWLCEKSAKDYALVRNTLIEKVKLEKPKYKEKSDMMYYNFKDGTYLEKYLTFSLDNWVSFYSGSLKNIGKIPEYIAKEMWELVEKLYYGKGN